MTSQDYSLKHIPSSGIVVDSNLAKFIHSGNGSSLLDVVRHDLAGEQYLLCDSEYAYGVIEFVSKPIRATKKKAQVIADSCGLDNSIFSTLWAKKRKFFHTKYKFIKFATPQRIQKVNSDNALTITRITLIANTSKAVIDTADPGYLKDIKNSVSFPARVFIIKC